MRPLQLAQRPTTSPSAPLSVSSPAAKLAHARLLQTEAYHRSQQKQPAPSYSLRIKDVEEAQGGPSQTAVILSPKRRPQYRNYATVSDGSGAPGPSPNVPTPKDAAASISIEEETTSIGDNTVDTEEAAALSAESQLAEESLLEMTGAEGTEEEGERLLSENFPSGAEEAALEEIDDAFPELLREGDESLPSSESEGVLVVDVDDSLGPGPRTIPSPYNLKFSEWVEKLPKGLRRRHPSLHSIIYLTRTRPQAVPNPSSLYGPIHAPAASLPKREIVQDYYQRRKELAKHISCLREDGVKDSLTWSYALWATIMLRAPGEPLKDAISLYNDLLSGTFVRTKPKLQTSQTQAEPSLGEPRKSWRDIEEEYINTHAKDGIIAPTEEVVGLLIRALALRDFEVHSSSTMLKHMHGLFSPLRDTPNDVRSEPRWPNVAEHLTSLEKENNFAPAMALVNATLQNRYPSKLGIVTYNLLLQSALNHARLQEKGEEQEMPSGIEAGGIPSAITIFAHLEKSGCRPSGRTFMLLMQVRPRISSLFPVYPG